MQKSRIAAPSLLLALTLAPGAALADQAWDDPPPEDEESKPDDVLKKRLYHLAQSFELQPSIGISLNDKFTSHVAFQLGALYHFTESFGFEVQGAWLLGSETNLTEKIRQEFDVRDQEINGGAPDRKLDNVSSEVTDRNLLVWTAVGALHWEPIYGKVSFFSDLDLHFGFYVLGGGGVAGVTRDRLCDGNIQNVTQGMNADTSKRNTVCDTTTVNGIAPLAHMGGGMRFFVNKPRPGAPTFSLKLEIRNHMTFSKVTVEDNFTTDQKSNDIRYVEATDVTHYPMAVVGAGINF